MAEVSIRHFNDSPSRRARLMISLLGRLTAKARWDIQNPAALVAMRKTIAVCDFWTRYLHYQWYLGFVVRRTLLDGVRTLCIDTLPIKRPRETAVLLYLHGGGFFFRMLNGHARLAANICRQAGIPRAYLPRYRLAPEHPYPAAVEDCCKAYLQLLQLGHEPARIILTGDSAGGGLVLATLMRLRDAGQPLPACAVLLSPVTDLTLSGASYQTNRFTDPILGGTPDGGTDFYSGAVSPSDPRVSPLFGDFRRLPPLFVQVGSHERLLDDSLRLADCVRSAKGSIAIEVWNRMPHIWPVLPLPESRAAVRNMARFIRQNLGATA